MKNSWKRLMSIVCALMMVIVQVPANVWAEAPQATAQTQTDASSESDQKADDAEKDKAGQPADPDAGASADQEKKSAEATDADGDPAKNPDAPAQDAAAASGENQAAASGEGTDADSSASSDPEQNPPAVAGADTDTASDPAKNSPADVSADTGATADPAQDPPADAGTDTNAASDSAQDPSAGTDKMQDPTVPAENCNENAVPVGQAPAAPVATNPATPTNLTADAPAKPEKPAEPKPEEKPKADHEMRIGDSVQFSLQPGMTYTIRVNGRNGKIQVDAESAFALKVEIKDETNNKTKNATGKDKTPFQTFFGGRKGHKYLISIKAVNSSATGSVKVSVIKYEKPAQQEQNEEAMVNNVDADKRAKEQTQKSEQEEKTDESKGETLSNNQEETSGTDSQDHANSKEVNEKEINDKTVENTYDALPNEQPDETGENKLPDDKEVSKETVEITDDSEKNNDVADNETEKGSNENTIMGGTDDQPEAGKELLNDFDTDENGTKVTNNDFNSQDNELTADAVDKKAGKENSDVAIGNQSAESGKENARVTVDEYSALTEEKKVESADVNNNVDSEKEQDKEITEETKLETDEKNNDVPVSSKDAAKADIKGAISGVKEMTLDIRKADISDLTSVNVQLTEELPEDPKEEEATSDSDNDSKDNVERENVNIPVAFSNDEVGSMEISKEIKDSFGTIDKYAVYTIDVEVTLNGEKYYVQNSNGELKTSKPDESLKVATSSPLTINNLPFGTYTITETKPEEVTVSGYSFIEKDSTLSIDVTLNNSKAYGKLVNVYDKDVGKLEITKNVTGAYTTTDVDSFQFVVKSGDKFVAAKVEGNKATYTELTTDEKIYSIKPDQTISFDQMPVGDYIVSEKAPEKSGYVIITSYKVNSNAAASSAQVEIEKDDTSKVEIDNHYRSAELVIKKTINGVEEADIESAAAKIKITVADNNGNKLLENTLLTSSPFERIESTYTAILKSTDERYAQYLIPDGEYTVTEMIEEPDGYGLISSKYTVTAKTNIPETDAESGVGYKLQLTDADVSKGEIVYTNRYWKAKEPEKFELFPYEGSEMLGKVKVGDKIQYQINFYQYKKEETKVIIFDQLDKNLKPIESKYKYNWDETTNTVKWIFKDVKQNSANGHYYVTMTVEVQEGALKSNGGSGKVVIGGDTATVKVGDDSEYKLNTIENPVPEMIKEEVAPYKGKGILGGVKVGQEITYEISYENYKAEETKVVIKDKLDPNVQFISASDGGTPNDGIVTWNLGNVPAGYDGTVTLTVKVKESALSSKNGPDKVINGGDTATVMVGDDVFELNTVENPVSEQELPMKKEIKPYSGDTSELGAVNVGEEITYEISYWNYKAEKANIVIKDKLDPYVKFSSASDGGVHKDGVVTWTLKDVPAGTDGKVTLTVKVLETALKSKNGPGKVVNKGETATVEVVGGEIFKLNTIENLVPEAPTNKEKSPYAGTGTLNSVKVDQVITYEISYKNYKTEKADIIITNPLDKYVSFVEASDGGKNEKGTVTWAIQGVDPGKGGTVTLKVKVLKSALTTNKGPGRVTNQASVTVGNDIALDAGTVTNPVTSTSPNTGDGFDTGLWLTLLVLSILGAGCFGIMALRGKKKADQKRVSG